VVGENVSFSSYGRLRLCVLCRLRLVDNTFGSPSVRDRDGLLLRLWFSGRSVITATSRLLVADGEASLMPREFVRDATASLEGERWRQRPRSVDPVDGLC
jgi:hypothetical protein